MPLAVPIYANEEHRVGRLAKYPHQLAMYDNVGIVNRLFVLFEQKKGTRE